MNIHTLKVRAGEDLDYSEYQRGKELVVPRMRQSKDCDGGGEAERGERFPSVNTA